MGKVRPPVFLLRSVVRERVGEEIFYNANQVLVRAIREGHRGAYWDILRRVHGD